MGVKCTCMGTASLHAWILRIRLFRTKMNLVCQKEKIKLDCWTLKSMLNFVKMKTHKRLGSKVSCFRIPMETIMFFVYSILGQSFNSSLMSCMFQSIMQTAPNSLSMLALQLFGPPSKTIIQTCGAATLYIPCSHKTIGPAVLEAPTDSGPLASGQLVAKKTCGPKSIGGWSCV